LSKVRRSRRLEDSRLISERRALLDRSQDEHFPYVVEVCDRDFVIHANVFSPKYFASTDAFSQIFPYRRGDHLLEIGCGCGATAVLAALKGATEVVAVDINLHAVKNTRANVRLHDVDALVDVRESDVFSALRPDERFRTIYWNIPLVYVDDAYLCRSDLERSVYDPGYRLAERYLKEAGDWICAGGRILVGFASIGIESEFLALAEDYGYVCRSVARRASAKDQGIEFVLHELTPSEPRSG